MKSPLKILKAVADETRMQLLNSLLEGPQCVEELAKRLNLSDATISFHLKKLENAALVSKEKLQYYMIYRIECEPLKLPLLHYLGSCSNHQKKIRDKRFEQYRCKVFRSFMSHGKIIKLPVQRKKRNILLEHVAESFHEGIEYSEKEVNRILTAFFEDYCSLRRCLVETELLDRANGIYRKVSKAHGNDSSLSTTKACRKSCFTASVIDGSEMKSACGKVEKKIMQSEDNRSDKNTSGKFEAKAMRSEAKRSYKNSPPPAGIFEIRNNVNGKVFIGSGMNLQGMLNRHKFQLEFGVHKSEELQKDWHKYGADSFTFSVIETLKPQEDRSATTSDELEEAEARIIGERKPFGESGYNTEPAKLVKKTQTDK